MISGDYKIITIETGRLHQNCYLVRHSPSDDLLLIDPGDDAVRILDIIEREGSRLKLILLTHAHYDHVGAVKAISDKLQLPFIMHSSDLKLFNRAPTYALAFEKKNLEISKNYRFYGDEDLEWSGHKIQIMHIPGHTPGGVCIFFSNIAFSGDTLLKGYFSHTALPGLNVADLHTSINNLLTALDRDTILFPGHGSPWPVIEAAKWWELQLQAIQNS